MKHSTDTHDTSVKKPRPVLKKISTVILILVFTGIVACVASVVTSKYIYHQPAALFGIRIVKILTDSMSPEIPANTYVLVKNVKGSDVKEGDIVVHVPAYGDAAGLTMTHKCIKGPYWDEGYGQTCILTQGTKEGAPVDPPVPIANVQSVYICKAGKAGGFLDFVSSIWGITVLVALPCLAAVIWQIVTMVRAVVDKPDEEKVRAEVEAIERERNAQLLGAMHEMADGSVAPSGDMGAMMAFIAREKAKQGTEIPADDPMGSVMAFIAKQKALAALSEHPDESVEAGSASSAKGTDGTTTDGTTTDATDTDPPPVDPQ